MRTAFYITSYNDPVSCEALLTDLARFKIRERFTCILSDGSDDLHAKMYAKLCGQHGFTHLRRENHGASAAKQWIINHAKGAGFAFMHQISEDFRLATLETAQSHLRPGNEQGEFLTQAMEMLIARPNLTFVNWTFFRANGDAGYIWGNATPLMRVRHAKRWPLLWVDGDIGVFGWPYTARVSALADRLTEAQLVNLHGEEALAFATLGHGVCLLAQPVIHTNRVRPGGSIP